jgi:hypothetical protein
VYEDSFDAKGLSSLITLINGLKSATHVHLSHIDSHRERWGPLNAAERREHRGSHE